MKNFILVDESDNFDMFLDDKIIKKYISTKISWHHHLLVQLKDNTTEDVISYILLKYGDNVKNVESIIPCRKPVMYVDYLPKEENKFTKYIYENQRNFKRR